MYKSALPDKQKTEGYHVLFTKKWIMSEDNVFSKHCVFSSSEDKEKKSEKVAESWRCIHIMFLNWTGTTVLRHEQNIRGENPFCIPG